MGDLVYLRLQPYKQTSMHNKRLGKLAPRYYGPFKVLQKVGEVSYKLDLPFGSLIHPVFHVSNLKAKLGNQVVPRPTLPAVNADLVLTPEPMMILDRKSIKLRSRIVTQLLVQWQGESKDDATWEVYMTCKLGSLTLWARCFKGGTIVRIIVVVHCLL